VAEPLKATFFTLQKRDRAVLLPATIVVVILVALVVAGFVALNWGALSRFAALFQMAGAQAPEAISEDAAAQFVFGMFGLFGSAVLFLFPLYLAIASYEAACLRWMIRGEAPGLFGLTLDHDTWRVYGVYWCWFLAHLVVGFAMSIVMMPIMFMMMGDIVAQGPNDPQSMWALQLKLQSLSLLQYIPLVIIGIRLGPAAATGIARREFSFFEAWNVTSDRFWTLLGSFALLWLLFGLANVVLFGATYGALLGDIILDMMKAWPNVAVERVNEIHARMFAPTGLAMVGAAYGGGLILWIGYALMSYGINARAVMAAVEEGKTQVRSPAA
jgi:hypothetical protein